MHNARNQSSYIAVPPQLPGLAAATADFSKSSMLQKEHSSAGHHAGVFFVATTATGLLKTEVPQAKQLIGTFGVPDSLA